MCQETRSKVSAMLERTCSNSEVLDPNDLYMVQHCQTFRGHHSDDGPNMPVVSESIGPSTTAATIMMIIPPEVSEVTKSASLTHYISAIGSEPPSLLLSPSITPPMVLSPSPLTAPTQLAGPINSEENFCDHMDMNLSATAPLVDTLSTCHLAHCSNSIRQSDRGFGEEQAKKPLNESEKHNEMMSILSEPEGSQSELCFTPISRYVPHASTLLLRPSISNSDVTNEPTQVDTDLTNMQSTRQQEESYQNKTLLAQKILSMIRNDDFEQFSSILRCSKPDLNVFINGQTALHYCLLLGRDVSWCKLLVLNGANPNLSNQDGWHPLHLAAFRGLKESVHYLNSCNNSYQNLNQINGLETTTSTAK